MISQHPNYISGRKKFEAQDFEGALADYNKAIEQEENPAVYSERAVVYYHLKQLQRSLDDMNYAQELEPDNPYRYSSRAYIKDAMGDTEGAIKDYEKAIELDPEDSIALNNLGLLQEKLGYQEKAKSNFDRADQLADVEKLFEQVRAEQKELAEKEKEAQMAVAAEMYKKEQEEIRAEREKLSIWAIMRQTFTTKNGFKEYLQFVKNGFKPGE